MTESRPETTPLRPASKIYVAGHEGMVGSAILRALRCSGFDTLITRRHDELDLLDQRAVREFMQQQKPDYVVLAAAKVGGIHANNSYPAEFIYQNLMIECNVIHETYRAGVRRLLFLGSSCIYPKLATQPMTEEALLSGALEPTNEPYAVAKIAGIKICESYNRQHNTDFRAAMPTNLYGINDNFHLQDSHVIPGLLRRFHEAKEGDAKCVEVWGSGSSRREFLFVDDMAAACMFIMKMPKAEYFGNLGDGFCHVNVGTGSDISISTLVDVLSEIVGYSGKVFWNTDMPDGTPRKLLDVSRLTTMGWKYKTTLDDGLRTTYKWFTDNQALARR